MKGKLESKPGFWGPLLGPVWKDPISGDSAFPTDLF